MATRPAHHDHRHVCIAHEVLHIVQRWTRMWSRRKEARRKALKEKAQGTKETGKPFEGERHCRSVGCCAADLLAGVCCCADNPVVGSAGEEFGSNYTPPESQKISPAFLKSI